jgi:hypothetical protein
MRNKLKELIEPSGKMFREKYVKEHYNDIYLAIINYSNTFNLIDIPFKQKVYHYLNDIKDKQYCSNPKCNNEVSFKNSTIGYYKYCCNSCISSDPNIISIKKNKSLEKFGTNTPAESDIVKQKIIETNQKRYGGNSPLCNKEIKDKCSETLYKNYGVSHPTESAIIMNKIKASNLKKYGYENVKSVPEINDKIITTMLSRHGVKYALQNENIKKKTIEKLNKTLMEKYLIYYPEYNVINIDQVNKEYTMVCEHGHEFKINYMLLNSRRKINTILCTICNPISKSISGLEIKLLQFISENYNGEILTNDRKLISKEIDIYLPELKLAFEFNGLFCHSELHKPKNYHSDKTKQCENNGVQLIHIYEDDWQYKENIIKSMILYKLGKITNKIYARNCIIKEVKDNDMIRKFLDNNHIQGFVGSSIKLGLFYNDELVSLMTFGKNRLGIGKLNKYDFELLRFCNKLNTNIIGGASKLFKYFLNNFEYNKIISYADRGYSNGLLYETLGFHKDHITKNSYHYIVDKIRKHRFNFRKGKLVGDGTEHEIMMSNNIFRIYNSGHICYVYKKEL